MKCDAGLSEPLWRQHRGLVRKDVNGIHSRKPFDSLMIVEFGERRSIRAHDRFHNPFKGGVA